MIVIINWVSILLLIATATGLFLVRSWRWMVGILAVQYIGVFWLVSSNWPYTMAMVKLLTGWTACAILAMTQIDSFVDIPIETGWPQSRFFSATIASLVTIVSLILSFRISKWLGIEFPVAWGSLLLIGMGLFYLNMTTRPMRICIGLLTFYAGFEILYSMVEASILVAVLLAVVTLGISLVGAYLISNSSRDQIA